MRRECDRTRCTWQLGFLAPRPEVNWGMQGMNGSKGVLTNVQREARVLQITEKMPCTQCARSAKFWMSPSTKGSIKQTMVQNAFGPVHKSLHTTCLKITHRVLILATGQSRGHTKDWIITLENGPSPSQPLHA